VTESALADLLHELLPMPDDAGASWESVMTDAAIPRMLRDRGWLQFPRPRRPFAIAGVVLAIAAVGPLTALAVSKDWWFLGGSSSAPAPLGKIVVVRKGTANGVPWALTAYRSATQGLCVGFTPNPPDAQALSQSGHLAVMSCGARVRGVTGVDQTTGKAFSVLGSFANTPNRGTVDFIAGPAAADVAEVRIVTVGGASTTVDTFRAPNELGMPIRFFVALLQPKDFSIHEVIALDSSGSVVERSVVPALPTGAPTNTGERGGNGYNFVWGS